MLSAETSNEYRKYKFTAFCKTASQFSSKEHVKGLTTGSRAILERQVALQLVKNFPTFHGI
jgi:hypothetical protein